MPYDKGRTPTYVHLSVQMVSGSSTSTSIINNNGDGYGSSNSSSTKSKTTTSSSTTTTHFTYVLDLNNIPKYLPVNTLGIRNTVKFVITTITHH